MQLLCVDGRIILKWNLQNVAWSYGLDLSGSGQCPVQTSSAH
jgi:hypothetical protein